MEKLIKIGTREVKFKATAATPMHYRNVFKGEDVFRDFMKLGEITSDNADIDIDFGPFEKLAYIMSGEFKKGVSFEDWLEGFEAMDIVMALPEIMELWELNLDTQAISPKNR